MEPFKHQPIRKESDEIRLIRFINEETIEIFHTPLDDAPAYRALSYAWGDEKSRCTDLIRVAIRQKCISLASNESAASGSSSSLSSLSSVLKRKEYKSMDVTLNCQLALQRLYEDNSITPVWIDAICIDQMNKLELNHQVKRMSRIYGQACKVQIFLGPGTKMSDIGFKYIKREGQYIDSGFSPLRYNSFEDFAKPEEQEGLEEILGREWFSRRWVLQEVHYAKEVEVLCGSQTIPWEHLRLLGYHKYQLDAHEVSRHGNRGSKHQLPPILQLREGTSIKKNLLYWMEETIHLHSKWEVDKVYSLLGMASDVISHELVLVADYTKDFEEVKVALFKHYGMQILKDLCKQHFLHVGLDRSLEEVFSEIVIKAYSLNVVVVDITSVRWMLLRSWLSTTEWLRDQRLRQVFPQETSELTPLEEIDATALAPVPALQQMTEVPENRRADFKVSAQDVRDVGQLIQQHSALDLKIRQQHDDHDNGQFIRQNSASEQLTPLSIGSAMTAQMREADALILKIRYALALWNDRAVWDSETEYRKFQEIHQRMFSSQIRIWTEINRSQPTIKEGYSAEMIMDSKMPELEDMMIENSDPTPQPGVTISEVFVSDNQLANKSIRNLPMEDTDFSFGGK